MIPTPHDIQPAERRKEWQERHKERVCRFQAYMVAGDPTLLEWILGGLKLAWGSWLLLPFHAFAAAPHLYRYVAVLPEWVWGLLMLGLGALQWLAWNHQWQKMRFFAGGAAVILWERLGWLMWLADHRSVSLVFLSVLSLFQVLAASLLYGKAFPSEKDRRSGFDRL